MMDPSDSELIERTLKGDEGAFAELVRRYQSAVWGTVHRVLGYSSENEDAVQEVFLRAYAALRRFDHRYPFGPWVTRIATNYCIDQLRRKRSRKVQLWSELREHEQERLLRDLSMERGSAEGASGAGDPEGYVRVARALLDGLNPKYRAAFILREVDDKDYSEVAAALGTSEVTARVRVSRARAELQRKFRAYLSSCGAGERER